MKMKRQIEVKQLNKRVCEVRMGNVSGIFVTEDEGETWEASPDVRKNFLLKKVREVYNAEA